MNKLSITKYISVALVLASTTVLASCGSDEFSSPSSGAETTTPSTQAPTTEVPVTQAPITLAPLPTPAASTVTDLLALGRPIVLAHASGEMTHPHSSLFGFSEAARMGVDVLDVDVQSTSDGVLVIHHDLDTGKTAKEDLVLLEYTYDELHALDNAYWFTANCTCTDQPEVDYIYRGVRTGDKPAPAGYVAEDFAINSLETLMQLYPDYVLNIEIKDEGDAAKASADALMALLTKYDAFERVVVASFDDTVVDYFHEKQPNVAMSPGQTAMVSFFLGGVSLPDWLYIVQIPPTYEGLTLFTPEYVARAKSEGIVTWVWPNGGETLELYRELLAIGADGINAASPPQAMTALNEFLGAS